QTVDGCLCLLPFLTRCPCKHGRPSYWQRRSGPESDSQSMAHSSRKQRYFIENATTDRGQPSSSRQLRDTTKFLPRCLILSGSKGGQYGGTADTWGTCPATADGLRAESDCLC